MEIIFVAKYGHQPLSTTFMSKGRVGMYDMDGNLISVFQSTNAVGNSINRDFRNISRCCKGYGKTAYGYVWRYLN